MLAGWLAWIVHGAHDLLAYGVFLCFLSAQYMPDGVDFWQYLNAMTGLHAVLLTVFLGGMTIGQRGFGSALGVVDTLGWLMPLFPLVFYLSVSQMLVGFLLFHSVNLWPKNPGIMVAFHQDMVLSITLAGPRCSSSVSVIVPRHLSGQVAVSGSCRNVVLPGLCTTHAV